ncbi:HAD-IA family hydrolase [Urbifossiella limnaea]|uniref:Phosphoglycolate phosphatase n=1 Tax=Urbifossiella limnaea TaxID=2528023 RepID=A0A517XVK3_9BACT|nr:HAD-IA family hydrolase [Urbifossiella limnaea]QDU21538.1 Phosphoglycolate phosphatase [Urbifossiella limnaea]
MIHPGARAVFFDAVGTLLFPAIPPADTYASAARRQGVTVDPAVISTRFVAAFRAEEAADRAAGWVTDETRERERWRRIVAASLPELPDAARGFAELFEHFARPEAWEVHPDAAAVFAELTRRVIVAGIGSNLDDRLTRVVAGHPELGPVAGRVIVSAAVGHRKPSGRFFAEVVRAAGCEPGEIVFVGDDVENDYAGAEAAGLVPVLLTSRDQEPIMRRVGRLRELTGEPGASAPEFSGRGERESGG